MRRSFRHAFRSLTGHASDLAVVASTLVIAALFQPLRRRIQSTIDHWLYRRKHDAATAPRTFNATPHNEVDMSHVHKHLLEVVADTMRPSQLLLWLREAAAATENRGEKAGHR